MGEMVSFTEKRARKVCEACHGRGWVCENHPDKPSSMSIDADNACDCGAAMPCPQCAGESAP